MMNAGDLLPIVAVIFIFGGGIIKRFMSLMERRMEMRMSSQDKQVLDQIAAVRKELAELRDTSTQYDMSVEHKLAEMEQRLGHMESVRSAGPTMAPEEPAQTQTIGIPRS